MTPEIKVTITRNKLIPAQTTNHILMIEPVAFTFNCQTSGDNHFQQRTLGAQPKALKEFQRMVAVLREHGVNVMVIRDTLLPHTPDSIFPNNAVSFHQDGKAFLYPMYAPNRRTEFDVNLLHQVKCFGFKLTEVFDMQPLAESGQFLEGTGSMVLDREHRIAYACRSERTNENWFKRMCQRLAYEPILFSANQSVTWKRLPIYHTNVMMAIAETFVVICLDAVDDEAERQVLLDNFARTNKAVIEITEKQMQQFAGNMLQVRTHADESNVALVMSSSAYNSLTSEQIARIESHCPIIHTDVSTIETNGGGSVRCMMAEVFLPRHKSPAQSH